MPEHKQYLYRHFDKDDVLLYVGISLSAINRLQQHRDHSGWFADIARVDIVPFDSRVQVLEAERAAIKEECPVYNMQRPEPHCPIVKKEPPASKSRADLLGAIVEFKPLYTPAELEKLLDMPAPRVRELFDTNKLGFVAVSTRWDKRWDRPITTKRVTGWQLIDFLENWEAGEFEAVERA